MKSPMGSSGVQLTTTGSQSYLKSRVTIEATLTNMTQISTMTMVTSSAQPANLFVLVFTAYLNTVMKNPIGSSGIQRTTAGS